MKELSEYTEELESILDAAKTHVTRFFILVDRYSKAVCNMPEFGLHMPPEKRSEYLEEVHTLLNYLEELAESVQDIGGDLERMGEHGKSFCEAVIKELGEC